LSYGVALLTFVSFLEMRISNLLMQWLWFVYNEVVIDGEIQGFVRGSTSNKC
jgi:hypothetical protein